MTNEESNVPVRIHDIALRLGVSDVTVSLALRNHPRISIARREQVQATAASMGYRPNAMATALAHRKWSSAKAPLHATIAWINLWHKPGDLRKLQEFELYWQGAKAEAESCGYRLEEFSCDEEVSPARLQKILITRNIRGLLLPPTQTGLIPKWGAFNWQEFSVVRFGYSIDNPRVHLVTSDQLTDGLIAYESIWHRGYRRIGMVTSKTSRTRFSAGYLLGQMQLNPRGMIHPLVLKTDTHEANLSELATWMKQVKPDAVLTDVAPLNSLLKKLGLRVPEHLGLAAMSVLDGNADAGIYQNSGEIGKVAIQLLISLLHHNETGIPKICREVLIEGQWVDGSTLPLKTLAG